MSDEAERGFVDSNILIYAHDRTAGPKRDAARRLITSLGDERSGCLSLQVLQEFFVIATRKIPSPVPISDAVRIISDFGTWRLHDPVLEDLLAATDVHERFGVSFWDAMIIRSASRLKCSVIWSEDLNPGQIYDGVRCVSPFDPEP